MTCLVLIESNTSGTGRLFVERTRSLGLEPMLLTRNPDRFPFIASDRVPVCRVDTADARSVAAVCGELGAGLVGVTTSSEFAAPMAAQVAFMLGLPGPNPSVIAAARDKHQQRESLRTALVDHVRSILVANDSQALEAAAVIGYPVVVKPRASSGSIGVRLCSNAADLTDHVHRLRGICPTGFLVEECLRGEEYSAEVFDGRVIGLTKKHLGAPPSFVEIGHDFPAPLAHRAAARIRTFATRTADALGLTFGPSHIELRDDGERTHLIEANPRLAGGFIPELVRLATGVDLIEATILRSIGRRPNLLARGGLTASIRFVLPAAAGTLRSQSWDKALHLPHVTAAQAYRPIGSALALNGDFSDRIGHVVAVAETASASAMAANHALDCVELGIEPVNTQMGEVA